MEVEASLYFLSNEGDVDNNMNAINTTKIATIDRILEGILFPFLLLWIIFYNII